jgi:uncharacterized cupin superfamily protein
VVSWNGVHVEVVVVLAGEIHTTPDSMERMRAGKGEGFVVQVRLKWIQLSLKRIVEVKSVG